MFIGSRLNRQSFPWREFIKSVAAIAIPVAAQNLLTTTASMIDTMMVAPIGKLSVAAIGLCAQFSSLMLSCYWGFIGGGTLFIAQYWGAKDDEGIERSYGMTLMCMMTVAFIFGSLAIFAPETIMRIYTDKQEIQVIGVEYLRIVGFAYLLQVLSMAMSCLLRSTERVKIPMAASIVSVAVNLSFNWLLIYGHWGFPEMGIRGAALATVISAAVNVLVVYLLCRRSGYKYIFHIKGHFKWSKRYLSEFFIKCFPIICNEVLVGVGNMVINVTLGRQPDDVIAALAVFRTFEGLLIGFFAGFSNASSVLVGSCVGAGELRKAYERAKRLVYMCCGMIAFINVIILAVHKPILMLMSLDGESLRIGSALLAIYAGFSVIRLGNWIQNDTYRASGDSVFGTVREIVFMYAMVLPLVLATGFLFKSPYWMVFICCYIDEPIRFVLMQRHLYSGRWIKPVTEQGRAVLPSFIDEMKIKRA